MDKWVIPTLWTLAALAVVALLYPAAWITQETFGGHYVITGPYALLYVFGLGVISIASFVLAIAVGLFAAARREDHAKSKLETFD